MVTSRAELRAIHLPKKQREELLDSLSSDMESLAELLSQTGVIEAVDQHVVALAASAVNFGLLPLKPDAQARLVTRFETDVRSALEAESRRRAGADAGEILYTSSAPQGNVHDHVWLHDLSRDPRALPADAREEIARSLPVALKVGIEDYLTKVKEVTSAVHALKTPKGMAAVSGGALVGGSIAFSLQALAAAVSAQEMSWGAAPTVSWLVVAAGAAAYSKVTGTLKGARTMELAEVRSLRASGFARAHDRDVAWEEDSQMSRASLHQLRQRLESAQRRVSTNPRRQRLQSADSRHIRAV